MIENARQPIDLKRLPRELQDELVGLQRPANDRFFFSERVSLLFTIPLLAAVAWLVYAYTAVSQPLWEKWMFYLIVGISVVVFPITYWALTKLIVPWTSKLKSGYIVTRDEFFKISGRKIEVWNLRELDAFRYKEHMNEIEVWIGDREETIRTSEKSEAARIDSLFDEWKESAGMGLGPRLRDPGFAFSLKAQTAILVCGLLISVGVGFAVGSLFVWMNRNFDDAQTWELAAQANTVEEFEKYKVRYPTGKFATEADKKIGDVLSGIADKYASTAARSADQDAVRTMAALLGAAAKRPDRTIFVRVTEKREIDESIAAEIKSRFGDVASGYEATVPAGADGYRREKVISDLKVIFTDLTGRGAIKLALADSVPDGAPEIGVDMNIRSEKLFFRMGSFIDGRMITSIFPVASFNFKVDVRPGSGEPAYHMEYLGQPMQVNSGVFDRRDKDNYSFDKLYFTSATDGLDVAIEKAFGLKEKN